MAKFDKIPPGSRFRAKAADALDGQAGLAGNGDLLVVNVDGSGELVLPTAVSEVYGIILTTEKTRNSHLVSAADQKKVVGGQRYTVMRDGEILDCATFDTPIAAGVKIYAAADGSLDVDGTPTAGARYIGITIAREEDSTQIRLVVDISQPNG